MFDVRGSSIFRPWNTKKQTGDERKPFTDCGHIRGQTVTASVGSGKSEECLSPTTTTRNVDNDSTARKLSVWQDAEPLACTRMSTSIPVTCNICITAPPGVNLGSSVYGSTSTSSWSSLPIPWSTRAPSDYTGSCSPLNVSSLVWPMELVRTALETSMEPSTGYPFCGGHARAAYADGLIPLIPLTQSMEHAAGLIQREEQAEKLRKRRSKPKRFKCEHCDVAFSNNGQLVGHTRIHTGERPFKCDESGCEKTFTRNEELTRHKRIHTGVRPHACSICGKCFGRKDHLKKHAKTHESRDLYATSAAAAAMGMYALGQAGGPPFISPYVFHI